MLAAESNKTSSPITIFPASGCTNPATQSKSVDFPAPEEPNKIVMPEAASMETSSTKEEEEAPRRSLRMLATSAGEFTSRSTAPTRGD